MPFVLRTPAGVLAALLLLGGCERKPELATVTGKVTSGGKPLAHAMVVFVPASGIGAAGVTLDDGTYKLTSRELGDGVRTGACTVGIQPADPVKKPLAIPARFRDAHSSGFTAEVKPGDNQFDFDVPSK